MNTITEMKYTRSRLSISQTLKALIMCKETEGRDCVRQPDRQIAIQKVGKNTDTKHQHRKTGNDRNDKADNLIFVIAENRQVTARKPPASMNEPRYELKMMP